MGRLVFRFDIEKGDAQTYENDYEIVDTENVAGIGLASII